jgi:hypothetical protein
MPICSIRKATAYSFTLVDTLVHEAKSATGVSAVVSSTNQREMPSTPRW